MNRWARATQGLDARGHVYWSRWWWTGRLLTTSFFALVATFLVWQARTVQWDAVFTTIRGFPLEGWRYSRHTLRLRKYILCERRRGKLKFAGEQDPVQIFADAQRRAGRRGRKQGTLALQLGQVGAGASPAAPASSTPHSGASVVAPLDLGDLKVQNQ